MLSSLYDAIANFWFMYNMHYFDVVLCDWFIPRISHDVSTFLFCLKDLLWLAYYDLILVDFVTEMFIG